MTEQPGLAHAAQRSARTEGLIAYHPILDDIRAARPVLRLLTDAADTEDYRWDETDFIPFGQPLAVAFPTSTEDVSAIVRACCRAPGAARARGAGTGLSGGAIAVDGALIVLAMTGMDRVLEVDPDNLVTVTQPGIINAELGPAVAEHGLFYPPDPASFELCSIGGNLAENSGGLRCVKYGVTRDYVLGAGGGARGRRGHPDRRQDRQGRHGLRPHAPVRGLGGHPRASSPRPPCG